MNDPLYFLCFSFGSTLMGAYLGAIVSIDDEKVVPEGINNRLPLIRIILSNIAFSLPLEVKYYGYNYIFIEALLK